MSLTATPPTLAFSVLERGHVHYAMTLQLHSFDAADAVELRMHCTNPRLTIEALPDQPGAVRVALLCSVVGVVQGSIVCTSSGGSITVPISARIVEPAKFEALQRSTPARAQPQPSGYVEQLGLDERPGGGVITDAAAQRCRPVVHVRAVRAADAESQAFTRRRVQYPAGSGVAPLVSGEPGATEAADTTEPSPAAISEHEHRAISKTQIEEGAVRQQRESAEMAAVQRTLVSLVRQVHVAMSALDRAEQDGDGFPESMRTLQAELRALDPLISEAESVMVRQPSP